MALASGVSLGQLMLAVGVLLATSGAAWGGLLQRVRTLESQIGAMAGFAEALGRIDERTLRMGEEITAMSAVWTPRTARSGARLPQLGNRKP